MTSNHIDLITLGCSKNLVDSERIIKMFESVGYYVKHNPLKITSKIVIINTCGFIGDAKEESINMILECVSAKQKGQVWQIYVMGCLSERYRKELPREIPEVDCWYGKFDWENLIKDISGKQHDINTFERKLSTPSHYAYIKIAEGCNRFCSFCAIPLITGRYKSRKIEDILHEVKLLVKQGVKEFNIIAQDLSYYGIDIYGSQKLALLIDEMAQIQGVEWIRLHYAYPAQFPIDLLDVMQKHNNICKYLDIALQHSSDKVLSNMRRHINEEETIELLDKIRKKIPGIHIRTTLMVGFPGEDNTEFENLLTFVKKQKFDRMGAFAYCEEEDTYAAKYLTDNIPDEIKQSRLDQLMSIQEEIAYDLNKAKVGQILKVIIDAEDDDYYIGRTEFDSPEVDPEVLIKKSKKLTIGNFYKVKIVEAMPFELIAIIVD
ncbi:MAG: 30S ribosomal protein S12 methylthiotransferase RimO [Bacteroidales bacterium]|nr:30S ribosomal protein S12 methylthiotransferase RimO [Bacteroidales bacterium]